MRKGCLLILFVLTAKIYASSHECMNSTETRGEKAGSSFSIAFTLSRHCPALLFIMVYVTQPGGQFKDIYCHFTHEDGKCTSSSNCVCDHPQQQEEVEARYLIKGNLSQAEAAGMKLMLRGTAKLNSTVIFQSYLRVVVRSDSDNITVEDDTQQSVSINITRENPPVIQEDRTTTILVPSDDSGDSVDGPDHTTIVYITMGCISFVAVVTSVVFGVMLYRKVLNARPKVHREPVGQEVMELPQLPVGNHGDPGNRESALSFGYHLYERIDDDISSIRPVSILTGWSETEFDSDHDNCPRAAEPGDYQNETPQVHYQNTQPENAISDLPDEIAARSEIPYEIAAIPELPYENASSDLPGEIGARSENYENTTVDLPIEMAARSENYENTTVDLPDEIGARSENYEITTVDLPIEMAARSEIPYENARFGRPFKIAARSGLPDEIAATARSENARFELPYENARPELAYENTSKDFASGAKGARSGMKGRKDGRHKKQTAAGYMGITKAQTPDDALDEYLRINKKPIRAKPKP